MTATKPQWPLLPPIRLAGVALLCAGLSMLVEGWGSLILLVAAAVFLVWAAVKFARVWRRGPRNI
jgi:hypothetical protein